MLKRIDSALSADFLWMLAAMGHGDDVALVDARDSDAAPRRTTTMPVVKNAPFILSDVGYLPAPVVKPLTM
jgi:L-fucose mutarotase/ribose pyranase (RbsD/FucU family)